MTEDYEQLESLMMSIPEGQTALLAQIGDVFASAGLCEQAVDAYKKCGQIKQVTGIITTRK
jgi:WD repeat-containing protein 35